MLSLTNYYNRQIYTCYLQVLRTCHMLFEWTNNLTVSTCLLMSKVKDLSKQATLKDIENTVFSLKIKFLKNETKVDCPEISFRQLGLFCSLY